ncbi:MAG: hypothetical protein WAM60_07820 [Candidatus Promineifilaceae bacterium]
MGKYGADHPNNKVITNVDQITTEWLTAVLTNSGALTQGAVSAFELGTGQGNWSDNANLVVSYSDDAEGERPERLFLKLVDTYIDEEESFGGSEVAYYTQDYAGLQNAPLLRCYDSVYSETMSRYHLLLQDVSETHVKAAEKEPVLAYGLALAEGLAALHSYWWGAERLAEANGPIHSADHIRRFVEIAEPGVGHILGRFSAELEAHWPETLRGLFAGHPQAMIKRTQEANGFTLIHGDVGHNNVLVPKEGDRPIYIIDRQPFDWSLTTWLGVYDLAYAIVLDWEIEKRRQLEMPVLECYYNSLVKNGVRGYSFERLYDDYRLCAAMAVYIAVEYCRGGVNERWISVWYPMLRRALTAIDDLNCSKFW